MITNVFLRYLQDDKHHLGHPLTDLRFEFTPHKVMPRDHLVAASKQVAKSGIKNLMREGMRI